MAGAPITPKFQTKAPQIMRLLIDALSDYDLSDEDAAAILGNFGTETGGFSLRLEQGKPKASQGFGWAQWTGYDPNKSDRRLLFENWCKAHGYSDVVNNPSTSPEDRYDEACYGYFIYEISETWEERVLTKGGTIGGVFYPPLCNCSSLDQKTISFMRLFERPGTPHEDWRKEMAHEALRLYRGEPGAKPMPYERIVISSGHSKYCRGACGILDEVDEARRITERLGDELEARGVDVTTYHDDVSKSQNENLNRIVDFHNSKSRDLDVSVHLNAYQQTSKPMGCEVLYVTQATLANQLSAAIASCGFINRGGKKRTDLFFLNNTAAPAVLLEICFVDSSADAELYNQQFDEICFALANVLGGETEEALPKPPSGVTKPEVRIDLEVSGDVVVIVNGVVVQL